MYGDWIDRIATSFQERFDKIEVNHNFEYGPEFEVALVKVLRSLLPARVGVCRGYVVAEDGTQAGDDIILFDQGRFPTLRSLGEDLSLKERVPADAVLAYVEAKHSLHLVGAGGQTLEKAISQAAGIKELNRRAVPLNDLETGISLGGALEVRSKPGDPRVWNPWYTIIIARNLRASKDDDTVPTALEFGAEVKRNANHALPDLIVAGPYVSVPCLKESEKLLAIKRFLLPENDIAFFTPQHPLGLGALHLFWALEYIRLGAINWHSMMMDALGDLSALYNRPR